MRKLLVFQHAATEPLGVLDPMLRRWGFRIRYVNFARDPQARPDVGRYNGLVVLGGPMNVDQGERYPHLATEIEAIREAMRRELPVLGICLGAQLGRAAVKREGIRRFHRAFFLAAEEEDPAREPLNAMAASRARASAAGATDGRSFAIWLLRRR